MLITTILFAVVVILLLLVVFGVQVPQRAINITVLIVLAVMAAQGRGWV